MKGGVRLWCATLHHIRIHFMKGGARLWCETLHHIRIQSVKGGVRLWCETLHQGWPRVWGGSRSTNPCVFPCKVASAGDERYLLCAAVAAAVVLVPPLCSATSGCSCAHSSLCFLKLWLQIALEWLHECCMGYVLGRKPDQEKKKIKWLRPAVKGTSCVRQVRLRSFRTRLVPPLCSGTSGCVCVRSSARFLNLWLQIALWWLHDCCHLVLPCV